MEEETKEAAKEQNDITGDEEDPIEISVHALASSVAYNNIRINGMAKKRPIFFLIDSDSTHNFRPVDRAFLRLIIGDLPLLADSPIDWTLLRTAISFWDTQHAAFNFQGTELAPTVEEYEALIQRPMPTRDIVVPNQTILFPHTSDLIDGPHAQVVLQVVGGHSYIEAVVAEIVRSFDYVREVRCGRMRRIFLPKRTVLLTGSCGQTLQLRSQRGFYESEKLDACGVCKLFSGFIFRNTPLMRSKFFLLPRRMGSVSPAGISTCSSASNDTDSTSSLSIRSQCREFRPGRSTHRTVVYQGRTRSTQMQAR
ncbi:hypothetical protein CRG98_012750 [Punica granatum]|uniref:Uncharacterized protein n=1 Tax=Punica granatum TaxID=22663 RepID=A0A2I0KEE6_PUNGR|nr:hypothetical protein CRG98_012750 [Punica granatum]